MFERDALETEKALIDCGATRSMGSWEALDGLVSLPEEASHSSFANVHVHRSCVRDSPRWHTKARKQRTKARHGGVPGAVGEQCGSESQETDSDVALILGTVLLLLGL